MPFMELKFAELRLVLFRLNPLRLFWLRFIPVIFEADRSWVADIAWAKFVLCRSALVRLAELKFVFIKLTLFSFAELKSRLLKSAPL